MQFRELGNSGLKVSTVGFGAWTIATDWWGKVEDPNGLINTARDCGINFFDTAPVYGADGLGETILRDLLKSDRSDIVLTTKCGYDIHAPRMYPGQSERPQDWRPEAVRAQLEESLSRLGTDYIDLYQLHNVRMDPMKDDDLWAELESMRSEGKIRAIGVALGPAIGWVEEGLYGLRNRSIASLQTVFNILEQEPGLTFVSEDTVVRGDVAMIARVPHASDVLSGKATKDTAFKKDDHRGHRNKDNMLDNFEKAETISFLWETGRTIGQAAVAGILANEAFATVLPTCVTPEEVREYALAADVPLTEDEKTKLDALWSRNFDHKDRFVMPLKSSV